MPSSNSAGAAVMAPLALGNTLCASGPGRPFAVGPQDRSRGEYAYQLWNNAVDDPLQPGYGKSPPELMQSASATTP